MTSKKAVPLRPVYRRTFKHYLICFLFREANTVTAQIITAISASIGLSLPVFGFEYAAFALLLTFEVSDFDEAPLPEWSAMPSVVIWI